MREEVLRSLLLIDSDPAERRIVAATASRAGWSLANAASGGALELLKGQHGREVRAALLSGWNAETGPDLITALKTARPDLPIIVLADGESIACAVDAMRAGANDFLVRPVAPERLIEALSAQRDRRRAAGELAPLAEKLSPVLPLDEMVGAAPDFRAALAVAAKAARNRLPILVIGEPGAGKETFARAIHSASLRGRGPLIQVDCKAVAANIIDSTLFGHVAGAFPGAFSEKVGKLLEAEGGTILLDDIGALPLETQAALDRVLATGEVRPVGCNGSNSVDIRLIVTSSGPLGPEFDPKLRERVESTSVTIPPLRDRSGDIPALARHLLARIAGQHGGRALSIGNDALAVWRL